MNSPENLVKFTEFTLFSFLLVLFWYLPFWEARMGLFLGIDGGGTGCRARIADDAGRILGEGAAGPANVTTDSHGTCANILAATRQALPPGADISGLRAVLGLAGANVRDSVARLLPGLPFAHVRVVSDALTATRGALGTADGIVAAIGTGSVFTRQWHGDYRQVGGWGLVLGDEGSGAWIGRAILSHALRARDGLFPETGLIRDLIREHGGPDGVVAFARDARPTDFAGLAPRIAASEDDAARRVMAAAADEVAAWITLLQPEPTLPVVLLGGLGEHFARLLAPRWTIQSPQGTALDGAVALARGEGA